MTGQKRSIFGDTVYATIEGERIDRLTNVSYDEAAKKADKKIEKNRLRQKKSYNQARSYFSD